MASERRTGVRFTRDVGPGSSGVRVSLRHLMDDGRPTDVLGELRSWSDGRVVVERRDGTQVVVAEDRVVAAKQVPPAPERR